MERLTEKLADGRNVLKENYAYVINPKHGSFIEGKAIDKLAEYEQAEEDGLLIRLPVAEGTHVYCIGSCGEICDDYETDCEVCGEHKVVFCTNFDRNLVEHFGETVFLTESEAEQALAKMKGV